MSLMFSYPPITTERPRLSNELERGQKLEELKQHWGELRALQRKVRAQLDQARERLFAAPSDLPHREELLKYIHSATNLLVKDPASTEFYPEGAVEKVIDSMIQND